MVFSWRDRIAGLRRGATTVPGLSRQGGLGVPNRQVGGRDGGKQPPKKVNILLQAVGGQIFIKVRESRTFLTDSLSATRQLKGRLGAGLAGLNG
jgi:hypothetical protein